MTDKIVKFSRLLKVSEISNKPAFIIELIENNEKKLYFSYERNSYREFLPYQKSTSNSDELSEHCLISTCEDLEGMFQNSHITDFEADCLSATKAKSMFKSSSIKRIRASFPLLENGEEMFQSTKIKEVEVDFSNLTNGSFMFANSRIEMFKGDLSNLEEGFHMFFDTNLKQFNSCIPKVKEIESIFISTNKELKDNQPYLFL